MYDVCILTRNKKKPQWYFTCHYVLHSDAVVKYIHISIGTITQRDNGKVVSLWVKDFIIVFNTQEKKKYMYALTWLLGPPMKGLSCSDAKGEVNVDFVPNDYRKAVCVFANPWLNT